MKGDARGTERENTKIPTGPKELLSVTIAGSSIKTKPGTDPEELAE